jgi:hypothetical protein
VSICFLKLRDDSAAGRFEQCGLKGMEMNSLEGISVAPSTQPALELISLARLSPEVARKNLRLLLLANPNHFGNLTESSFQAVLGIREDQSYESIGCIRYSRKLERLRASIKIKQDSGYSGNSRTNGSKEYVRFYLSYDGGTIWQDQGSLAIDVFDVPGPKPLEYAVTLPISPEEEFWLFQSLPKVRAILSWNSPPPAGAPDWTPVWGNVANAQAFELGKLLEIANGRLTTPQALPQSGRGSLQVSGPRS